MYKRADVKVWFACNNLCDFCVQGDKRFRYKQRTLPEITQILDEEYKNGCLWVVFTGWEPTVHPNLIEAVRYAKNLGYLQIQIQSNGRNFAKEVYVDALIEAGVTEFGPSIHGFHPSTHDSQVHADGAWEEVIRGIVHLKKRWQMIVINSVITQSNYQEIPELAALLIRLWVQQFQFAFVHILWSAEVNKETVVPRKTDIMPYVYKALDLAKKHWVLVFTEAIPYCFMQWYEWAIAENMMPETTVVDAEYRTENYEDYRWSEGKAKHEKCVTCLKNSVCEGPWKEYPELYSWDEFHPITEET